MHFIDIELEAQEKKLEGILRSSETKQNIPRPKAQGTSQRRAEKSVRAKGLSLL